MALANGFMRRPLSGTTASGPDSPTPMTEAPSKMPPLAYQLTLTLGTEPVFGLNDPRMEKCGSGPTCILGSLSWSDETSAAMREHAAETACAADSAPSSAVRANCSNAADAVEVAAGREATSAEGTVAGGDAVSATYFVHVREKDPEPEPDPDPDPTPTPDPGPEPTPEPNPDPTPEPDPDPEPAGEAPDGQADAEPLPESGDATSSPGVLLAVGACGAALVTAGIVVVRRRGGR